MLVHSDVKYLLKEPGPAKRYGLWIWHDLTEEYIFERSVNDATAAKKAIDQLLSDRFIRKSV